MVCFQRLVATLTVGEDELGGINQISIQRYAIVFEVDVDR